MNKENSIRKSLKKAIIFVFAIIITASTLISSIGTYRSTARILETTMVELVELAAQTVSSKIEVYNAVLNEASFETTLSPDNDDRQAQIDFVQKLNERYGAQFGCDIFYAGNDGIVRGLEIDISEREFYKKGIAGEHYLSDPIVRKDTGELGYTYVVPVNQNGIISGILYMIIDYDSMFSAIASTKISGNGGAYAINAKGTLIIDEDEQKLIDGYNLQDMVKKILV